MDMVLHQRFDHLELSLEPTTTVSTTRSLFGANIFSLMQVNTYNVCTRPRSLIFGLALKLQKQVTFSARVAWMSDAAECFDMLERDVEDMTILASDGSSGLFRLVWPVRPRFCLSQSRCPN